MCNSFQKTSLNLSILFFLIVNLNLEGCELWPEKSNIKPYFVAYTKNSSLEFKENNKKKQKALIVLKTSFKIYTWSDLRRNTVFICENSLYIDFK